ncbi:MFS transporter [Novosphingobium sediminicola]|uniref:MFS family permease n=1 Tax=Novosphingobium sediminicola TaxID=563162 RepID=A0A7W6G5J5_9SPHN|nr:MFS transporter [Novosphingobium sediminicola]MBB3954356.1 MFS family permease [Novosphingobium sediminicola]
MATSLNSPATETTETDEAAGISAPSSSSTRWFILFLLALGVLISFIDRTSIGSAIADKGFVKEFGLSNVGRGWINSAFFWSYGIAQVPMGWLVDRYGVKRPYAIFFAMWCVICAVTGTITLLPVLFGARLLVGVAEAIVIPASYRWIRNNFDESRSGLAVGIFAMGNKFGPAIGAPAAAWLIYNYSWRAVFYAMCAVGVLWLASWVFLVRDDTPRPEERAAIAKRASGITLGGALRSPVVWGGMLTNFCYGYFTFYCMTWMPAYLVEKRGLSLAKSGVFTFFSFAGIAIMAAIAGWAADMLIARGKDPVLVRKGFVIAGFFGGCTVLLGSTASDLNTALFWNVTSLTLLGLATANNLALCRLTLIPKQAVGLVTGVQQVATSLAGGVSASLSGWLLAVSGSYDLPMKVIFVFLLIGAAGTWILLRPEWAPKINEN